MDFYFLIKPDFVEKGGYIAEVLREHGWEVLAHCRITLTKEQAEYLYLDKKEHPAYEIFTSYASSGESELLLISKEDCTNAKEELHAIKWELRKAIGIDGIRNVAHTADDDETIKREQELFGTYDDFHHQNSLI